MPTGITTITVTGKYLRGDLTPAAGFLTFVPSVTVADPSGPAMVATSTVTVPLDGTGAFSVGLAATDDVATSPTGWAYTVTENIDSTVRTYQVLLPHTVPSVDISNLTPATTIPTTYSYATTAALLAKIDRTGDTMTGALVLAADPLVALGAATKQYVDAAVTGGPFLPLTGGSLSGPLTVATLRGSTSSAGTLTLNSTSHATKGKILLGASSAYDEANVRLGIGITSPTVTLDVETAASAQLGLFKRTSTGNASPVVQVADGDTTSGSAFGMQVVGDAQNRFGAQVDGKMTWGSGSTTRDTNLYRNAAAELKSDHSLTVVKSVTVGGAQLLAGGVGVLGLNNAATPPSGTPSGGVVVYASAGGLFVRDVGGTSFGIVDGPPAGSAPTGATAETIPRWACGATTNVKVSGTLYLAAVWLQAGQVITNISMITGGTAAGTPTHWWFALIDKNMTLRGHTADQTTGAIAANTLITKALVTPYTATYTGPHYIGAMVAATTPNTWLESSIAMANQSIASPPQAGPSTTGLTTPGTDGSTSYAAITQNSGFAAIYAYLS